jgi:hypothetical protein
MKGNLGRLGFAAAALLAACAFSGHEAAALPISAQSFSFDGTVTEADNASFQTGINVGDHIQGSLTFSPVFDDPDIDLGSVTVFNQVGSFSFSAPAPGPFTVSGISGNIQSGLVAGRTILYFEFAAPGFNDINLYFKSQLPYVLDFMSSLPGDAMGVSTILGPGVSGDGNLLYQGSYIAFDIRTAAVAATPVPGTLWLFVSALGGLGMIGWTRRRAMLPVLPHRAPIG